MQELFVIPKILILQHPSTRLAQQLQNFCILFCVMLKSFNEHLNGKNTTTALLTCNIGVGYVKNLKIALRSSLAIWRSFIEGSRDKHLR